MDLEERSIEELPDRCQNCGAKLTDAEKQAVLESDASLALCTTCAAEQVPLADDVEAEADY
jgi:uncharacterized protein with PIN domain